VSSEKFSEETEIAVDSIYDEPTNAGIKRYVITSVQNNSDINEDFLSSLDTYCSYNEAQLMIVPFVYNGEGTIVEYNVSPRHRECFVNSRVKLHDELFVMGHFNFSPTTVNPFAGMEPISKGNSLIIPSPQLRMKSLAMSSNQHPAILITTGAISVPNYLPSKTGERASFNHSFSAVVVEIDSDNDYHIRVLNADITGGFYDLDAYYTPYGEVSTNNNITCLVTGDEHAIFACPDVESATYTAADSIVNILNPKVVVRHDLLDCYSVSHHHRKDSILSVGKYLYGNNSIQSELDATIDYLERTTGDFDNVIVSSNHNDHLTKWLKEVDIKSEPWNALLYHQLMYLTLASIEKTDVGISYANPFETYFRDSEVSNTTNVKFLGRDESFTVHGIELNAHGDVGVNGSRSSLAQYSNLAQKYVIGHSHTPGIIWGAYQVGTSSRLKLEYNRGPSSWMNTHCIIHENGKRQLINIINGKWRAK
jgi:hypothetical protein